MISFNGNSNSLNNKICCNVSKAVLSYSLYFDSVRPKSFSNPILLWYNIEMCKYKSCNINVTITTAYIIAKKTLNTAPSTLNPIFLLHSLHLVGHQSKNIIRNLRLCMLPVLHGSIWDSNPVYRFLSFIFHSIPHASRAGINIP